MTARIAACYSCKHYQNNRRCAAFGERPIPESIMVGINPHTQPVPGDHGITFEWRDDEPEPDDDEQSDTGL